LKIGALLLTIVVLGAKTMQPSFAKEPRVGHAGTGESKDRPAHGAKAKAINPVHGQAKDTNDIRAKAAPPRSPGEKPNFPENFPTWRAPVMAPNSPPRNSIGAAVVAPHENITAFDRQHFGPALPAPFVAPGIGRQPPAPIASMPGRGAVDGATLIRPAVALQGLGGPAKVVAGINGTKLRSKH
jgi:hypothetical protein